jgi:uridine phosphorylase
VATIIRVGTCGALRDDIADGDLIVAHAAVRDEGLTPRLVPLAFPAAADPELSDALRSAAGATGGTVRSGVVLATDLFYPSEILPPDWRRWQAAGVLAVEMETSALFVIAALHGQRAAAVLAVDGNPTRAAADMSEYDPYREVVRAGTDRAIAAALETLSTFRAEGG